MSFLGNYLQYLLKLKIGDRLFFVAIITNSSGSAGLKIMIEKKESGSFLRIMCLDYLFQLRFKIRSPKLPLTPTFSLTLLRLGGHNCCAKTV